MPRHKGTDARQGDPPMLTREELAYSLEYRDGGLYWIRGQRKGARVGRVEGGGYRQFRFQHYWLKEHRVIFMLMRGRWPRGDVDHLNGDRQDNRIENLREATRSQNCANQQGPTKRKRWGHHRGVHWIQRNDRWRAEVKCQGTTHREHFEAEAEAVAWVRAKRRELFGAFAGGDTPQQESHREA